MNVVMQVLSVGHVSYRGGTCQLLRPSQSTLLSMGSFVCTHLFD